MQTRRRFLGNAAMSTALLGSGPFLRSSFAQGTPAAGPPIRLAVLGSTYRMGSALQQITDRFLVGYPLDGEWHMPAVQVASLFIDEPMRRAEDWSSQFARALAGKPVALPPHGVVATGSSAVPAGQQAQSASPAAVPQEDANADLSAARAKEFGFRISRNIPDALRCGGNKIAVDAVLTVVEQDGYPSNDRGQILLPNYDFFQQCVQVFETERRALPYFNYRDLSFSFMQALGMTATARRLRFPFLAGASMPFTWRLPDTEIPMGAQVQEAIMVGIGTLNDTGYDALEAMQSMLERRRGGETGVKTVQLLEGDDVWMAGSANRWSNELLGSALSRSDTPLGLSLLDGRPQDLVGSGVLPQLVPNPAAACIEYTDGTRATLLLLNGAIRDFNFAARLGGQGFVSMQFLMPPPPNHTDSARLVAQIEQMYVTGRAPVPVERTLLTTGMLEALLESKHHFNQPMETPNLSVSYAPASMKAEA
jgi:hypothetical protein